MPDILFICTGNICRSPTAEAVMRKLVKGKNLDWHLDSVGTHGYHIDEAPDPRAQQTAKRRGVDMSKLRARQLSKQDFHDFDLLYAMDQGHLTRLQALAPAGTEHKLKLFLNALPGHAGQDVPDPYYGGAQGFEDVFNMIKETCNAILAKI